MNNKKMKKGTNKENVSKSQQSSSMTGSNSTDESYNQNCQQKESTLPRPVLGALNPLQPPISNVYDCDQSKTLVKYRSASSDPLVGIYSFWSKPTQKLTRINLKNKSRMAAIDKPSKTDIIFRNRFVCQSDRNLLKATTGLAKTYMQISKIPVHEKENKDERQSVDRPLDSLLANDAGMNVDEEKIIITKGDIWNGRYCIKDVLGKGMFGQVFQAKDLITQDIVAIKIIKDNSALSTKAAKLEVGAYTEIFKYRDLDQLGSSKIIRLYNYFKQHDRVCLVFEYLQLNLYEFLMRDEPIVGLSLNMIAHLSEQICQALRFLTLIGIIHCDLKPENIMLYGSLIQLSIRLVDFGSSYRSNQPIVRHYVQSRFYRAPEVVLSLNYSHPVDMWSLGCIMVELHTGRPLFPALCSNELLVMMIEMFGKPPNWMVNHCRKWHKFFDQYPADRDEDFLSKYTYQPKLISAKTGQNIPFKGISSIDLNDVIGVYTGGPEGVRLNQPGHSVKEYEIFVDLLNQMFILDPMKRIKPDDALQHPYFISRPSKCFQATFI